MTGLLAATAAEATWLIERLAAAKVADEPLATYAFAPAGPRPGGEIVVSGVGAAAAAAAAEYLIDARGADVVVNVGICGAVADDLIPGQIVRITGVIDGDEALAGRTAEPITCDSGIWPDLPPKRLATVARAVFHQDRREALARRADVVDMEGLAIARICAESDVPLHMLKGVSDLADERGAGDIRLNIEAVSVELAAVVAAGLARLEDIGGHRSDLLAAVMRFVRIEHTLFSLPLLLAGAYLGAGGRWPGAWVLVWIVLAGAGARTLGMAMNRIFDRDLDARNDRTAGRELPAGRMTLAAAWCVAGGGLGLYVGTCAALGPMCLALCPLPAAVLGGYSLLKRVTSLCHFGIGLCLAMAPLAAYIAAASQSLDLGLDIPAALQALDFSLEILLLALFAFFWISGFDIIYALMDIDFDRQAGVHSIPAALGPLAAQVVAAGMHLIAAGALVWLWVLVGRGMLSAAALGVAGGAFAAAYCQRIPVAKRFFPLSAVAGVAGALVPMLGGLP